MLVYQRVTIQKSPKNPTEHKTRHRTSRRTHLTHELRDNPVEAATLHEVIQTPGWIKVANWDNRISEPKKKIEKV